MKTFQILGILIAICTVSPTYALKKGGYGMGNGGDAVVCYTNASRSTIKSVQMFDYWEQEQVIPFGKIDLGAAHLSVQDKIQIAVDRIDKFDPELSERVKFHALNLANNIQSYLVTNYQLPEIDDANPKAIPNQQNCFIEQFGIQYKDVQTGQRRFLIADKFYNFSGTSNDDKAGLLLHEAIYRYAILQRPSLTHSDGVRYFNYVIGSKKIDSMTLADAKTYDQFISESQIKNKTCSLSLTNQIPGQYLVYANDRYMLPVACYNQQVILNSNVAISIPQGTTINPGNTYDYTSVGQIQGAENQRIIVSVKYDNSQLKNYYASSVNLKTKDQILISLINDQNDVGDKLKMSGPQGTQLICESRVTFDYINLQVLSCYIEQKMILLDDETYILDGLIKKMENNLWSIENLKNRGGGQQFHLLGSKNGTKIQIPFGGADINYKCKSDNLVIDGNFNLVSGCIIQPTLVNLDGVFVKLFNDFKIDFVGGNFVLSGFVNYGKVFNPTYQGLNLIQSSEDIQFDYCQTLDYKPEIATGDLYFKKSSEYVGALGKSYFDLSTNSKVFKTDEDVEYIESLYCNDARFSTSNY